MLMDGHLAALRTEGERFVVALSGAELAADLAAIVPSCPEWTVRELAQHVGRVHRWAASYPRDRLTRMMAPEQEQAAWGAMPRDAALADWFREGHTRLVTTLAEASADVECWAFLPAPSPLAFWARRQAHETAVHRVDLELALGQDLSPIHEHFAVDGVDELLMGFYSRVRNRVRRPEPATMGVVATDASAYWLVRLGPDGARARRCETPPEDTDATVSGPAVSLYLGLWNRGPLGEGGGAENGVVLTGDTSLVQGWRELAKVTWS